MKPAWQRHLPMWITMSRIVLAIPIIYFMRDDHVECRWLACVIFCLASVTDYCDGYFARKYNATTNLGKFMDPVADKILVSAILIMLVTHLVIDPIMVILIITRDTLIGGLRSVAAADQIIIDAKPAGKWKTALQMTAIPFLILGEPVWKSPSWPLHQWAYVALWVSTLLSVTSGWDYFRGYQIAKAKKA